MSLYNTSQCAGKAARDGTILALAFLKAFSNFLRSYSARGISTDEAEVAERCGARTFGKALERGQGLATVALLDTDVDIVRLRPDVLGGSKRVSLVCEGICTCARRGNKVRTRSISPEPTVAGVETRTESVEVLHAHATKSRDRERRGRKH